MLISEIDKKRISATIAAAELKTAGEIFCVIARQSGDYRLVPIVWAAFAALLLPLPLVLFTSMPAHWIYIAQLALFAMLTLALSIDAVRFRIVPRRRMHEQAHAEAVRQFVGIERAGWEMLRQHIAASLDGADKAVGRSAPRDLGDQHRHRVVPHRLRHLRVDAGIGDDFGVMLGF